MLETSTASVSNATTRRWQSASPPRLTGNNERGPERHRSRTPTTPLTWDVGGQNQASGTVVVPELETDNQSSTGPEAKAGRDQRATGGARVKSEARAKRDPRAEKRSKSCNHEGGRERERHEPRKPGVWPSNREREVPDRSPRSAVQRNARGAEHSVPPVNGFKFRKLKEEVVQNPQSYIGRRMTVIQHTLGPDHAAVKSLSAFGDQSQKFAAEILTIIEWGTQHWKLQEPFPIPMVPWWLRMPCSHRLRLR